MWHFRQNIEACFGNLESFHNLMSTLESLNYDDSCYESLMPILVELNNADFLKAFLEAFSHRIKVVSNSPILIESCKFGDFDMTKILLKYGFRLHLIGEDEIEDFRIFEMMVTKSYILSCYEAAYEAKGLEDCTCQNDVQNDHFCPSNPKFKPSLSCDQHVECNDPVTR